MKAGKPLVWYMGDDSRNEYIYKFVSNRPGIRATRAAASPPATSTWTRASCTSRSSCPTARGQWLELTFGINGITPAIRPTPLPTRPTC